jgi:LytR cell envelope-related transcriptional attenuator
MSGEDQYGDYSRREQEGQEPYARRAGRSADPYAGREAGEPNQAGGYPGRSDGAGHPRSHGRDYSGRSADYATGAGAQDYQQQGGYPTQYPRGYSAGQAGSSAQAGYPSASQGYGTGQQGYGAAQGNPQSQAGYGTASQQDYGAAQDYSQAREYRSYRRGEYRPRGDGGRSDLYGGGAGGGGREPRRSGRDVIGVIASSLFAVLAVLALVGVLWLIIRDRGGDDPGTQAGAQNSQAVSPSQSNEPSGGTSKEPTANPAAKAPVVVLNAAGINGLAASVTNEIKSEGWETQTPGNYQRGVIDQTTVFYPTDGMKAAAENLKNAFPNIKAVEKADATMKKDALTLVLTNDWE